MEEMYQKSGYTGTSVHYQLVNVDQSLGQAGVLFQVTEKPKINIKDVQFIGATAFTQSKLRKVVQTRRHWMFSIFTGHGVFKEEDFDDDPGPARRIFTATRATLTFKSPAPTSPIPRRTG